MPIFHTSSPASNCLLEDLGEALPPARRELLRRIFGEHPRLLFSRLRDERGFTLVHGDLNPGNLLWPRQGTEPVYLIDRQPFDWSLQRWLGVSDLARLMIIPWAPELRREWQLPALRCYQEVLARAGVKLPWPLLLDDYRLPRSNPYRLPWSGARTRSLGSRSDASGNGCSDVPCRRSTILIARRCWPRHRACGVAPGRSDSTAPPNSDVAADGALGRCAPSGPRS